MERASEMLLMGLRLTEGIDAARFARAHRHPAGGRARADSAPAGAGGKLPRMARRQSGRDTGGAAAAGCAVGCDRPLIPIGRTVDSNVKSARRGGV